MSYNPMGVSGAFGPPRGGPAPPPIPKGKLPAVQPREDYGAWPIWNLLHREWRHNLEHAKGQPDYDFFVLMTNVAIWVELKAASGSGGEWVVSEAVIRTLLTALIAHDGHQTTQIDNLLTWSNLGEAAQEARRPVTVRDFRRMSIQSRYKIINKLWGDVVERKIENQDARAMREPDLVVAGGALPTSCQPSNPDEEVAGFVMREADAWRTLTIGFRCEGDRDEDRERIVRDGFQPLARNPPLLWRIKRQEITGTIINTEPGMYFFKDNCDSMGESLVCISRTLVGATAFPERKSVGTYYLWAIDCRYVRGFDTEDWQISGSGRLWIPGEKAFPTIGPQ